MSAPTRARSSTGTTPGPSPARKSPVFGLSSFREGNSDANGMNSPNGIRMILSYRPPTDPSVRRRKALLNHSISRP